jgi:2-octaprenyl-6-methoxyphenol hydroxylase
MRADVAIDVLILGAGPVGCAAALALRDAGLKVALSGNASPRSSFRPLALSYASRLILERLGAWPRITATPIESIRVSQAGGFGRTQIDAADAGVPALGYVTDYEALSEVLQEKARELLTDDELPARCIVHAEGWARDADEKHYAQHALVALVSTDPPSLGTAFERFTPEGPLALLPLAGRYALIWSTHPERARALAAAGGREFLAELAAAAGAAPGVPLDAKARAVQPLVLRVRATRIAERVVYIGNAAQTLHPVAGQGLNLGLRDAWDLAQVLRGASDPGESALLERYAALRRPDAGATVRATDLLASAFLGSSRLARAARGAALTALDVFPAPRRFFARRMIFGNSGLPWKKETG